MSPGMSAWEYEPNVAKRPEMGSGLKQPRHSAVEAHVPQNVR